MLRIWETFHTFAEKKKSMAQGISFEVVFMDEAMEFINTLPNVVREKIYYNVGKVAGGHGKYRKKKLPVPRHYEKNITILNRRLLWQ